MVCCDLLKTDPIITFVVQNQEFTESYREHLLYVTCTDKFLMPLSKELWKHPG